jgi:DNA-binding GntR family transcriptional regulator
MRHNDRVSARPLNRVSTVDALTEDLRAQILNGELTPGTQLREVDLAAAYGVGRYSLRSAMQALVFDGLLRHEPNRGVFVPQLSAADVEDLFVLRTALETEAARRAVETRADLGPMEAALLEMEAISGDGSWDQLVDIDLRFHRELIDAVGSQRLSRTFTSLQAEARLLMAQVKPRYDRAETLAAEHRAVYEGVAGAKVGPAVKAVREHLDVGVQDILRTIR